MNFCVIGSGGREHMIIEKLSESDLCHNILCIGNNENCGIIGLATFKKSDINKKTNNDMIVNILKKHKIDICVVGPEKPLENGLVDILLKNNIKCIGPTEAFAQLETSKSFARYLMKKYNMQQYSPKYKSFMQYNEKVLVEYFSELNDNYVVKADGLMSGKGVRVEFKDTIDALTYCQKLNKFIIEERLYGQEYSLMSF